MRIRRKLVLCSWVLAAAGGSAAADVVAEAPRVVVEEPHEVAEAPPAVAEAPSGVSVHYTVEATSVSSYVWRGILLSSDRMAPALQPYGELDIDLPRLGNGRLAIGVWTSRRMTEDDAAQEIDPYLWYQIPVGNLLIRAGYIVYVLPDLEPMDTMHEVSAQVTWLATPALSPFAGVAIDPIRTKGGYAFAGAAYTRSFGATTLTTTGNVGASKYDMMPADLQDVTLSVRGSYAIGGAGLYVAATAAASYSGRDAAVYPYAGLSVGLTK